MTTKCLDNKIFTFKILLSWRFPRKIALWTIFLSAPLPTPSLKNANFIFIVVSLSMIYFFAVKNVVKFPEVVGVTNFKPDFLGKIRKKICHQNSTGFFTRGGGCKNPKFHHLDLLGPPSLNKSSGCCHCRSQHNIAQCCFSSRSWRHKLTNTNQTSFFFADLCVSSVRILPYSSRKVWVSRKFLSAKLGFTPPPPEKGPK